MLRKRVHKSTAFGSAEVEKRYESESKSSANALILYVWQIAVNPQWSLY